MCFFWGIHSSSIWLESLLQEGPLFSGQAIGAAVILADPIFQGLAISLPFGLLSSTALTVLVIPAIYRLLKV